MKKLKILTLVPERFPPYYPDICNLWSKELGAKGHRLDWMMQSEKDCDAPYEGELGNGTVFVCPTDNGESFWARLRKNWMCFKHELGVYFKARQGRYDIVQVKDKTLTGLIALAAARLAGSKFIFWLSYPFPEHYIEAYRGGFARYPLIYLVRGHIIKFLLYKVIMPFGDLSIVQSEQMKADIAGYGVPPEKMLVVPMGVARINDTIKDESEGARNVLYLGTLNRVRKLEFLIRAYAKVVQEVPDAKFYFIGRGEHPDDEKVLEEETARQGLQKSVIFKGFIPFQEAAPIIAQANLCVAPYYPTFLLNSASPTKTIEYLSMGKPVVGTRQPEQDLILGESGGGICTPYDEAEFAKAIVRLLKDPAQARQMGQKGKEYVREKRLYSVIADRVERELQDVVNL